MSSGTPLRIVLVGVALVSVALAVQYARKPSVPAALPAAKEVVLQPRVADPKAVTQKARGPLAVVIKKLASQASNSSRGTLTVLQASVRTTQQLKNVQLEWNLPSGVELVSGSLHETIRELRAGQPAVSTITVRQTSTDNQQVHMVAWGEQAHLHFAAVGQYNTTSDRWLRKERNRWLKSLRSSASLPSDRIH